MNPIEYRKGELFCEDTPLAAIARAAGTPTYVYSSQGILARYRAYDEAFGQAPHRVCFAVKSNSNLAILSLLAQTGAGFDIVSAGELFRVLRAGGDPAHIVFSGVGKTAADLDYALESKVEQFNCESEPEMVLLNSIAGRRGIRARVAVRFNPDVDAATHPYISTGLREHKFGISITEAEHVYARAAHLPNLLLDSVSCHIGSQILDIAPMLQAFSKMVSLVERLRAQGHRIRSLDLGGGLGVSYQSTDSAPHIRDFIQEMCRKVAGHDLELLIEPGRSIVAESGVLLTQVLYRKTNGAKQFVIVDAAMNDLIRPALYQSHHDIVPLIEASPAQGTLHADIVGPVCESGDFLARDREIANVLPGDYVAVCTAGAYGFVASSNYNSRPRAAEVLVEGARFRTVRQRETFDDLIRGESIEAHANN